MCFEKVESGKMRRGKAKMSQVLLNLHCLFLIPEATGGSAISQE